MTYIFVIFNTRALIITHDLVFDLVRDTMFYLTRHVIYNNAVFSDFFLISESLRDFKHLVESSFFS